MYPRKRRKVTDKELAKIMERKAAGVTFANIAKEFGRSASVIYSAMKRGQNFVQLSKTQLALEKVNESPVTRALTILVDELSKSLEVESVYIEPKSRRCKLVVRKELELTV